MTIGPLRLFELLQVIEMPSSGETIGPCLPIFKHGAAEAGSLDAKTPRNARAEANATMHARKVLPARTFDAPVIGPPAVSMK